VAAGYFTNETIFAVGESREYAAAFCIEAGRTVGPAALYATWRLKGIRLAKEIWNWEWSAVRLRGTRELNGLRVLMAVLNNWT